MPHSSVIGLYVYCKGCSHKFLLGSLNARAISPPSDTDKSPFDMGWVCWCDHCSREFTYQRADFVA